MKNSLYVINLRGEKKPFSFRKLCQSARRVGASKESARRIAKIIQKEAYPGIKTSEIFEKIKKLLSRESPKLAIKFSLKKAMRKLGPTGFPFEKYIGEIFSRQGFKVELNRYIPGHCLRYEIDFLAQKEDLLYIGECKYRNLPGNLVHSKDTLVNYARFSDIKNGSFLKTKSLKNFRVKSILVTNTRFTRRAVRYSRCVGVELLGWRYPEPKGLEYLIDSQGLYPITVLPSLRKDLADVFSSKRMTLAKDVLEIDPLKFSKETKIPQKYLELLIKEAKILLGQ